MSTAQMGRVQNCARSYWKSWALFTNAVADGAPEHRAWCGWRRAERTRDTLAIGRGGARFAAAHRPVDGGPHQSPRIAKS